MCSTKGYGFDPFGLEWGIDFNCFGLKLVKVVLHSGTGIWIWVCCFLAQTTFLLIFVFGSDLK